METAMATVMETVILRDHQLLRVNMAHHKMAMEIVMDIHLPHQHLPTNMDHLKTVRNNF